MKDGPGAGVRLEARGLGDQLARRLRKSIMTGDIGPGARILPKEVEAQFGVSHIPVREALRSLEGEGWVERLAGGGVIAVDVGLEEITAIWELRRVIEGYVVHRAASNISAAYVESVETALIQLTHELQGQSFETILRSHREFHAALLAPASTSWTDRVLHQLWQGSDRYIFLFAATALLRSDVFASQHRELAVACRRGDPAELQSALVDHISMTESDVGRGLRASRGETPG